MHSLPLVGYPSCRHTTAASFPSQPSSHTVPQLPDLYTSTRPSHGPSPLTSRTPIDSYSYALGSKVLHDVPVCTHHRDSNTLVSYNLMDDMQKHLLCVQDRAVVVGKYFSLYIIRSVEEIKLTRWTLDTSIFPMYTVV